MTDAELVRAELAIRNLLSRYCGALDRRDLDAVRACFHDDATDDHGVFAGTADEFVAFADGFLAQFEQTMHVLGTVHVDVQNPRRARSESYVVAIHRLPSTVRGPARDHVVGARYVDELERRDDWRIARRTAELLWTRTDPVPPGWTIG